MPVPESGPPGTWPPYQEEARRALSAPDGRRTCIPCLRLALPQVVTGTQRQVARAYARVRVVGSDRVYKATKTVSDLTSQFVRDLFEARNLHARVRQAGNRVDDAETIKARMDLGTVADAMTKAVMALEAAVRKEMSP